MRDRGYAQELCERGSHRFPTSDEARIEKLHIEQSGEQEVRFRQGKWIEPDRGADPEMRDSTGGNQVVDRRWSEAQQLRYFRHSQCAGLLFNDRCQVTRDRGHRDALH
ncbi:MAG: hypothetical protein WA294_06075 [Acidobacteriaceae bacterium]